MAKGKKTFIFYSDWTHMINEMPNEDAGKLIKHILSYVNDENPVSDNPLVKMAFGHMKPLLKTDLEKWEVKMNKYSEMGKKSAAKRALNKVEPTSTYVEPTSTVNDNDNVNVKKNTNTVPFEKRHVEFAKWFYNQLQSNGIVSRKSEPTSKGWVNPVKLLEESDGIDWDQIKKGALFYFNNHEEKFMPVIQSTTAFREKWDNLRTFLIKKQSE